MDIALLSTSAHVFSSNRILEEADKRGHYIELIDPLRCSVLPGNPGPRIFFGDDDITDVFDAVIPRIGGKVPFHSIAMVRQFEFQGVFTTAKASALVKARNKIQALQLLAREGLPIPRSVFSMNPDALEKHVAVLGGPPIVVKIQEGTQGIGVVLAESMAAARSITEAFYKMETGILLQEFIPEAKGEDLRLFVVGDKVVSSIVRSSARDDFRSNIHRGGSARPAAPTHQEKRIALRATRCLGLAVAGVDLIRSNRGPLLLEVNASPGLRGIEEASGKNIAGSIITYLEKNKQR